MANEKRLIDANALRKAIDLCDIDTFTDKQTICEQIAEAPTVDAVEVVHGHWIVTDDDYYWDEEIEDEYYVALEFACSECGKRTKDDTNYCPNCGAKMDGDGNG